MQSRFVQSHIMNLLLRRRVVLLGLLRGLLLQVVDVLVVVVDLLLVGGNVRLRRRSKLLVPLALALLLLLELLLLDALGLLGALRGVLLQPELLGLRERTDICGCDGAEGGRARLADDASGEEHVVCLWWEWFGEYALQRVSSVAVRARHLIKLTNLWCVRERIV